MLAGEELAALVVAHRDRDDALVAQQRFEQRPSAVGVQVPQRLLHAQRQDVGQAPVIRQHPLRQGLLALAWVGRPLGPAALPRTPPVQ